MKFNHQPMLRVSVMLAGIFALNAFAADGNSTQADEPANATSEPQTGTEAATNAEQPLPLGPKTCGELLDYAVTSVTTEITNAEPIQASVSSPWTSPDGGGGSVDVTSPICRIAGSIKPTRDSDIRFELWMPLNADWNGNFAGTASGGSNGYISYRAVNQHLSMGYASIGHDNGHRKEETDFALVEARKIDFAYRAQHVATLVGKEITEAFYDATPQYAYYNGCSQSGHHGMMEMQRYPDDYDGIIAGAPANDWTGTLAAEANAALAQWSNKGAGVSRDLLAKVGEKVLQSCDGQAGIDHLQDGMLDDPRKCNFDPASLQCDTQGADSTACLTQPQVQALRTALDGRRNTSGDILAMPYLAESLAGSFYPTDQTSPTSPQGSWANHWSYAVHGNPTYDFSNFDWPTEVAFARGKEGPSYDAINGNYSVFANQGGKFLMYHGWADSLIPASLSLQTWDRMNAQMGKEKVDSFARLFMVPGMDHCGGGSGASSFELMSSLADWVENDIAPDSTSVANTPIATREANTETGIEAMTRPLCPFPAIATYSGNGDVNAAENFSCSQP
ncbi:tannase/feruloyl esterase family alpha/beta hydrolase [Granulosicoccus antarcticus]|uniref:Mono(2-hydroxyethyl) terephthalate hydrolase n=1 Tax=Granulosicoccus antarcticus IMCC3135 TaxID=1192854 RepID=A0A2Z2P0Q7_9GAMM|nr:tannase/feruloyl esterase family alpha/beta hydrolase [Granulosicoccus antarcticus]ASJ74770.1 Mono(2-hydroxyethyl) terephthalate hydrolase [Granulosicoccus antarcticus IMCC3135]